MTRKRVVKGQIANPVEPSKDKVRQAAKKFKKPSETKPVKEVVAKLVGTSTVRLFTLIPTYLAPQSGLGLQGRKA